MAIVHRILFWSMMSMIVGLAGILLCDGYISDYNRYSSPEIDKVGLHDVGLVLGTSKYTIGGTVNLFYKYRLEAAIDLYRNGVIRKILVSGDNGTMSYNEPQTFFNDLVKAGVAPNDIFLDFAGFRTLDSVVRAKKVFKQSKILIISQQFHNERALFLARKNGIEAYAFNAKSVSFSFSPKTFIRESLARVKAVLDIYILGTSPKFLGDEVVIS